MTDLLLLLPVLIITSGAILLMLLAAFENVRDEIACFGAMVIFLFGFCMQLFGLGQGDARIFSGVFNEMLVGNSFTAVAGLIITACGFFTCLSSHTYFKQNRFITSEYYALTAFAASGMMLLTMAQELITAFISLEIMSLAIYVLVGMHRRNIKATEAVLKYLMLGAFAGGFFAMGSALMYGGTGSTKFAEIAGFISANGFFASSILVVGAFFILVALLFKIAAFPFHAWVVDVYDGAAMPVTGFMATALKTAVFAVFANFLILDGGLQASWVEYLFYIAVFTMFGGNLIAIGQNSLKRMLAASGIVHSGYLLIALVAFTSRDFTANVIVFYLAAYAVATMGMFAALSYLSGEDEQRITFDDFRGLAKVRPFSAAAISIFLLSMAGIPPTVGFMGKFYIIVNAINAGQVLLAVLAIVSSVISMWYYLRLIITMYFHEARDDFAVAKSPLAQATTFFLVFCVFALSLLPVSV
ncbi:MAG: NADH-quinone oxidoreductase subunit N [Desulfocapsaceae bacterium]|nr:NADH-quinone oxidoreductase subunit N [Desulfocapsaceae bacterium]